LWVIPRQINTILKKTKSKNQIFVKFGRVVKGNPKVKTHFFSFFGQAVLKIRIVEFDQNASTRDSRTSVSPALWHLER